jgi:ubiquinone/menaquinone biosynthesis C-methylase UbiE
MSSPQTYIMGHTDRERRRLAIQAEVLRPITEKLFEDAGIRPGMNVLDLGCGVGDVSMILSRIVGSAGSVTGLDFDPGAIATARARVADAGICNVTFIESNVADYRAEHPVDAVVGRHVLIHTPDPVAVLQRASEFLRPGGILAFQEYDLSTRVPTWPEPALNARIMRIFIELFPKLTHANAGSRLHHWFRKVGFPAPHLLGNVLLDGSEDTLYYEWMAETLRTILPRAEQIGVAKPGEFDLDRVAPQLRDEALANEAPIAGLIIIGAHSRKPQGVPRFGVG